MLEPECISDEDLSTPNGNDTVFSGDEHLDSIPHEILNRKHSVESSMSDLRLNDEHTSTPGKQTFALKVTEPTKVGEGLSAYIAYRVKFHGSAPHFDGISHNVLRRFSDFLWLHNKLVEKYLSLGVIIPPGPNKDVFETAKLKLKKDSTTESVFIERRRIVLERFLSRLLKHSILYKDDDLKKFLEFTSELPRSSNTQLISGTSAKKFLSKFGDAIGLTGANYDDPDAYFISKLDELTNWESQLKQLHSAMLALSSSDHDLSIGKHGVSRSVAVLANLEEHTGLAQALARLGDTEEQVGRGLLTQSETEMICLVDCINDTLGMVNSCKESLSERMRILRECKALENLLRSKQGGKLRLDSLGRLEPAKSQAMDSELELLDSRVNKEREKLKSMSFAIKREFELFDVNRFTDLLEASKRFLDFMLKSQTKVLQSWQAYITHTKMVS